MNQSLLQELITTNTETSIEKSAFVDTIIDHIQKAGYTIVEINAQKPWGAYIRFAAEDADRFVGEFFPDLTPEQARLGIADAELSPKILIVTPGQRLSWQYHNRRAERWKFLNDGAYYKSDTDEQGEVQEAASGMVVQFVKGERHRLVGVDGHYTLVAEIWQHADAEAPSNEEDIVRVADDYQR